MLVTKSRLRAIYVMLQQMPPFDRWGLPDVSKIRFEFVVKPDHEGAYNIKPSGIHVFMVNPEICATLQHAMRVIAHEMIHARQEIKGRRPATRDEQHNRDFNRWKNLVCRSLGFDSENF